MKPVGVYVNTMNGAWSYQDMGKILIACEFSGIVRDAFIAKGYQAVSCDLIESERPGPHILGDVLGVLGDGWDMMIAHPPCTYLANSGVRWLHEKPGRWGKLAIGASFFKTLLTADIMRVAVENPIPHKYAVGIIGRKYDQIIQPWEHGHGETKATCLWLDGLPPLEPSNIVEGRNGRVWRETPGPDRWKNRSRTYQGIAEAMADQWGPLIG